MRAPVTMCKDGHSIVTPDVASGCARYHVQTAGTHCAMSGGVATAGETQAMSVTQVSNSAREFDEDAWDDLLNYIEERRVIPIIGPELLRVQTDAARGRCTSGWPKNSPHASSSTSRQLPQPLTLNDVVCCFLGQRGRREEAYTRLRSILREAQFEPPLALRQLAQITDFDLFVTTTFDPLLEQAINLERFGGAAVDRGHRLRAQPRRRPARPSADQLQRPVVYHLLGRLSASPTYVISDEDMLEFICALQSEHLTPEKLFHELEHNHLLLIGSDFSNWLARLFLRMAKRKRLSDPRDVERSVRRRPHHAGRAAGGVPAAGQRAHARLQRRRAVRRRAARALDRAPAHRPPASTRWQRAAALPAAGARNAGQRDLHQLCARGPGRRAAAQGRRSTPPASTTWFDLDRLEGGDDYDRKIRANIARCSFFLPVISATTQRRHEAYFRREWSYAVDRTRNIADGALFILPVCIDDTNGRRRALVPEQFKAAAHHAHPERRADAGIRRSDCRSSSAGASLNAMSAHGGAIPTSRPSRDAHRSDHQVGDPQNPWLGLFSYTEETRAYFHGRDEETAELARRVQRKLLTVLFGQSGLGKTSLLRAGIVPRLRAGRLLPGLCAHRLRARFAAAVASRSSRRSSAPPSDAGHWTRPGRRGRRRIAVGVPAPPRRPAARCRRPHADAAADLRPVRGDLHARRRPTTPAAARARSSSRTWPTWSRTAPPAALEARIDEDDSAAERFRFRARRLPRPDRAARGLPRASGKREGHACRRSRRTACGWRG